MVKRTKEGLPLDGIDREESQESPADEKALEGPAQDPPEPEFPGTVLLVAPDGFTNVAVESVTYKVQDGLLRASKDHAILLIQLWGFTVSRE